ncbi:MAG: zinc ribbon domain-containing protein [Christensenellaceae bacterium]
MSKICLNCGYEADDNAKFCIRCGSRFSDKSAEIEKSEATDRAERSDKSGKVRGTPFFPTVRNSLPWRS